MNILTNLYILFALFLSNFLPIPGHCKKDPFPTTPRTIPIEKTQGYWTRVRALKTLIPKHTPTKPIEPKEQQKETVEQKEQPQQQKKPLGFLQRKQKEEKSEPVKASEPQPEGLDPSTIKLRIQKEIDDVETKINELEFRRKLFSEYVIKGEDYIEEAKKINKKEQESIENKFKVAQRNTTMAQESLEAAQNPTAKNISLKELELAQQEETALIEQLERLKQESEELDEAVEIVRAREETPESFAVEQKSIEEELPRLQAQLDELRKTEIEEAKAEATRKYGLEVAETEKKGKQHKALIRTIGAIGAALIGAAAGGGAAAGATGGEVEGSEMEAAEEKEEGEEIMEEEPPLLNEKEKIEYAKEIKEEPIPEIKASELEKFEKELTGEG